MEKYILDTCTWIEYFHERNGVPKHVDAIGRTNLCASEVSLAELTYGAINSSDYERHIKEPQRLRRDTALHYGLTVVTDNIKHFSLMPGVKCVNWIERE